MIKTLKAHTPEQLIEHAKELVIWDKQVMAASHNYACAMLGLEAPDTVTLEQLSLEDMEEAYHNHVATYMVHILTQAGQQYYNLAAK
ncbi:hypothetical protein STASHLEY_00510 [Brevundimonas phage vB_BpoS-StAshley]|nr:hypothetical protein STASHLEY_00510 [Brevundimonas phage vB_BpoS-StAshley]